MIEKKRTIDERNSRFKQESTNFINDLKLQIEAEKINNQVKNREIKNKYQQMMSSLTSHHQRLIINQKNYQ